MLSNKLNIIGDRYQIKQKLSHKAGRQTLLATDTQSQELVIFNSTKSAPAALQEEDKSSVDFVNLKSHHRNLQLYRGRYRLHISYHEFNKHYGTLCIILVLIFALFCVYILVYFGVAEAVYWGLFYQFIAILTFVKYIPVITYIRKIYIYKIGIITGQSCDKKSTEFQWPSFFDFHSKNKYIVYNSGYSYNSDKYFSNKRQKIKESDVVVATTPKLSIYIKLLPWLLR